MKQWMMVMVYALGLTACSSQYIMSTTDGQLIATESKPTLDKSTDMYRYYDHEGREVMIKKDAVTQIMER